MNPNNPLVRHSGEGRNPVINNSAKRTKAMMLSHLRGYLLIIWIPAFAGMTHFLQMDFWDELGQMQSRRMGEAQRNSSGLMGCGLVASTHPTSLVPARPAWDI